MPNLHKSNMAAKYPEYNQALPITDAKEAILNILLTF